MPTAVDPEDVLVAIREAISVHMPGEYDMLNSIRSGIEDAIAPAIGPVVTPLPHGWHFVLDDGSRGCDVIAVRTDLVRAEFLTENGVWLTCGSDTYVCTNPKAHNHRLPGDLA